MTGLSREVRHSTQGPPVHLLRLDRVERRNALDLTTVEALLDALRAEPEAHVLLGSTSSGIFCAGADLSVPDEERALLSDRLYECYETMVRRPGVVVAVVDGAAVGGGAQLAAAADLRVAGPAARWRWVGPGHGLAVGAWILPQLFGRSCALDLTLTGRWLQLDEALRTGFVNRCAENAWSAALELVDDLGTAEPAALSRVKDVATQDPILEALEQERHQNRRAWDGHATPPRDLGTGLTEPGS